MRRKRTFHRGRLKCYYCTNKVEPSYKEFEILTKFINDRGKINSRDRSGTCAKHQRYLARAIKRARHLALLPFVA